MITIPIQLNDMDPDVNVWHENFMQSDLNMRISKWSTLNLNEIKPYQNQNVNFISIEKYLYYQSIYNHKLPLKLNIL